MSNSGAYGAGKASDTDFRRTFSREEYAKKAEERAKKEAEESKLRYEAKRDGKAFRRRASTPEDIRDAEARTSRLDVASMVGKQTLLAAGAGVGRRGKTGGFYCEVCDESYKDSNAWVEHLNGTQHRRATGQSNVVTRSSLEEVHNRLRYLKRKERERAQLDVLDIDTRLGMAKDRDEQERMAKREKRNEKRRKKNDDPLARYEIKMEGDGIIS